MARPKKFRLDVDQVTEPENAKRLAGFVLGIEEFREEAARIQEMIASLYDDADEAGFDKGLVRKTVARRARPALEREAEENGVEAYALAVEKGFPSHARVENSDVVVVDRDDEDGHHVRIAVDQRIAAALAGADPITGEILESRLADLPRSAVGDVSTEPDRRLGDEDGQSNSPETAHHTSAAGNSAGDPSVDDRVTAGADANVGGGNVSGPDVQVLEVSGAAIVSAADLATETVIGEPAPLAPGSDVELVAPILTPAAGGNTAEPDSTGRILSVPGALDHKNALSSPGADPAVAADPDKSGGVVASPAPGVVTYERCPPNPVHWHDYAKCFPEMFGLALLSLSKDIERNGVRKPIVKIGDAVLDGRSRYNMARQLVGEGLIESYPVVEYAGDDALRDVVRWNLESGRLLTMAERKVIATKLSKLPGNEHRGSEIAEWFGLEVLGKAA